MYFTEMGVIFGGKYSQLRQIRSKHMQNFCVEFGAVAKRGILHWLSMDGVRDVVTNQAKVTI